MMLPIPLRLLAFSLQETSRVLSQRNEPEQAQIQECAVQMIGSANLDDVDVIAVKVPETITDFTRPLLLSDSISPISVWQDEAGEHVVIAQAVEDEDDWAALPLMFQNHVKELDFPCQLVVFVEAMRLESDIQPRHYAEPILWILSRTSTGVPRSRLVMGTAHLRSKPVDMAIQEGLAHIEPYIRIAYAGLALTRP